MKSGPEFLAHVQREDVYMLLSVELQQDLIKIAKRIPGMASGPDMQVLRKYVGYEWQTALRFVLDHAMQFDRHVDGAEYGLRALHNVILNGKMQLTDWRNESEPPGDFFAAIHFIDFTERTEVTGLDLATIPAHMFIAKNGMRLFKCEMFSRTDCTLLKGGG